MSSSSPNMKYIRRHYHKSNKAGIVYCCSSYELKACLILDDDPNVVFYETQLHFTINNRKRIVDFIVKYKDGSKRIIEVKPERRLHQFEEQIDDNKQYAQEQGYGFEVWSEGNLGFKNDWEGKVWADKYISELHGIDYLERRREMSVRRAKKHYNKHIAQDKVEVFCKFCNATHEPLRLTYEKNIERNGEYICERHGGHLAGSKPGKKLVNPHAADGTKQCNRCEQVKLFEGFGKDKAKSDGYATRCKKCRNEVAKEKYMMKGMTFGIDIG